MKFRRMGKANEDRGWFAQTTRGIAQIIMLVTSSALMFIESKLNL